MSGGNGLVKQGSRPAPNPRGETVESKNIEKLKQDYPEEYYDVKQHEGKVVINEKKTVFWMPKRFSDDIKGLTPQKLSAYIEDLIETTGLDSDYFEIEQKLVTLKCSKAIAYKANECKCTKIALIRALLESKPGADR